MRVSAAETRRCNSYGNTGSTALTAFPMIRNTADVDDRRRFTYDLHAVPRFMTLEPANNHAVVRCKTHLSTGATFINRSSGIVLHPLSGTSLLFSIIFLANGIPSPFLEKSHTNNCFDPDVNRPVIRVILMRAKAIYPRPDTIWFECKTPLLLFWFIRIFICQRDKYESI